jgi:poly(A) polymerase
VIAAIREKESVTAILGRKNNQMILEAVERVGQLENFKNALRLLKVWAKKKGVYSNALGFLGGIALAIMVAKMCQLFPRYSVPLLLREFFSLYSCWDWKIPVMIEPYRENVEHRHADLRWRKEARDFAMAVLTPGFPEINTTSRVNRTTLQVLKNCLRLGKLNYLPPEGWDCLFR